MPVIRVTIRFSRIRDLSPIRSAFGVLAILAIACDNFGPNPPNGAAALLLSHLDSERLRRVDWGALYRNRWI
ncbi:hypothetical protein PGQ11_002411 [Apiospora arundinis]|uniref:Uncharacterized protein n=1 Tax=Apiospora arundinis TaxID=335852 RepID=A0ABR2JJQ5_9PEZI